MSTVSATPSRSPSRGPLASFENKMSSSFAGRFSPHSKLAGEVSGGYRNCKRQTLTPTKSLSFRSISAPPSLRRVLPRSPGRERSRTTDSLHSVNEIQQDLCLEEMNVMEFLELACPEEVLPKVLAFAGPQTTAALAKTNSTWKKFIVDTDSTWKVLCQELYKWKEGDNEPETSWKEFYRLNPCVPVDYPSINSALALAKKTSRGGSSLFSRSSQPRTDPQTRSIRVLLRPGTFELKESINIVAEDNVTVAFETIEMPENIYFPTPAEVSPSEVELSSTLASSSNKIASSEPSISRSISPSSKLRRLSSVRNLLRCSRGQDDVLGVEDTDRLSDGGDDWRADLASSSSALNGADSSSSAYHKPPTRATLLMRPHHRRQNEPVIFVRKGAVSLKNIDIEHNCNGVDIWNGNSAIQLQSFLSETGVMTLPRPSAVLDSVKVTSYSGRGIVCIDGGSMVVRDCAIVGCAATGVYVGGPGSEAVIERTDVVRNGLGNRSCARGRGIGRGHSGVYLEQGVARIVSSNISENVLTGISSVSHESSILHLSDSELNSNGTFQIEMPPPGTPAYRQSNVSKDNVVVEAPSRQQNQVQQSDDVTPTDESPRRRPRMRSGLLEEA